ncbi:hypothetical protein ACFWIO_11155 [Streptomyces diastatochromogenes]|uniref:hypothetical protein n=1 Tax=Streptomyces diastatochromogenes TaxID=42236 RepID=UPI00364E810D
MPATTVGQPPHAAAPRSANQRQPARIQRNGEDPSEASSAGGERRPGSGGSSRMWSMTPQRRPVHRAQPSSAHGAAKR